MANLSYMNMGNTCYKETGMILASRNPYYNRCALVVVCIGSMDGSWNWTALAGKVATAKQDER
eukprot:12415360-Prorocentrum_lima.AAC.1